MTKPADTTLLFDTDAYISINHARWAVAQDVLRALSDAGFDLRTAFDFGAGPGWFAERLHRSGLEVVALEGRPDIVAEGRARAPQCEFEMFDFDNCATGDVLPPRDFSLSFGILYHLENPLRALRMMAAMTSEVMLLETMVAPGEDVVARIARENPNETQGIQPLSMILSRNAMSQALWATGIPYAYARTAPVDHKDFHPTPDHHPRRGMWLLSRRPVEIDGFAPLLIKEPQRDDYWRK